MTYGLNKHFVGAGFALAVAYPHLLGLWVEVENILFTNNAAIQVAREILDGASAFADMLALNPLFGQVGWARQSTLAQGIEHFGAEHGRQLIAIEEITPPQFAPLLAAPVDYRRWHDDVHMRVILESP